MRVALFGNNDGPARLARALAESRHEVVFTGLQQADYPDEESLALALAPLTYDVLINCFANFRYRTLHQRSAAINVHLAPLPRYRGRHPLQWALINGERQFGATIHDITDGYDAGPIRWQGMVEVADGWSARQLREALMRQVEENFADFLDAYDPGIPGLPNYDARASYVTRRYPSDSEITDWSDRELVFRKVMALRHDDHPAYVLQGGTAWPLREARRGSRHFAGFVTGTVVGRQKPTEIEVVCGDGRTVWLRTPLTVSINERLCKSP